MNFHCLSPVTSAICNLMIPINQRQELAVVFRRLAEANQRENGVAAREDKVGRDSDTLIKGETSVAVEMTAQTAISLLE